MALYQQITELVGTGGITQNASSSAAASGAADAASAAAAAAAASPSLIPISATIPTVPITITIPTNADPSNLYVRIQGGLPGAKPTPYYMLKFDSSGQPSGFVPETQANAVACSYPLSYFAQSGGGVTI